MKSGGMEIRRRLQNSQCSSLANTQVNNSGLPFSKFGGQARQAHKCVPTRKTCLDSRVKCSPWDSEAIAAGRCLFFTFLDQNVWLENIKSLINEEV